MVLWPMARRRLVWHGLCAATGAVLVGIGAVWRTDLWVAIVVLAGPLQFLLIGIPVGGGVYAFRKKQLPVADFAAGLALLGLGIGLSFWVQRLARVWQFEESLPLFTRVAGEFKAKATGRDAGSDFDTELRYWGLNGGTILLEGKAPVFQFRTPMGPSVDFVLLSEAPIAKDRFVGLEQVRHDDAGYWYFADR